MFSFIFAWTNGWANHRDASDLERQCTLCDVTVMPLSVVSLWWQSDKISMCNQSEIWWASRWHCCAACQISKWYDSLNCQIRSFETCDPTIRRFVRSWICTLRDWLLWGMGYLALPQGQPVYLKRVQYSVLIAFLLRDKHARTSNSRRPYNLSVETNVNKSALWYYWLGHTFIYFIVY